ncbi:hypothetical protein UMZ34_19990 [Halopseudomonas pachastrellae]|nr:hypothetical protein UMZ34_19990 [Halopseudomonas pachastrellae]
MPDTKVFDELARQSGNAQLKQVLDEQDAIKQAIKDWSDTAQRIDARRGDWTLLTSLLDVSHGLAFHAPIQAKRMPSVSTAPCWMIPTRPPA